MATTSAGILMYRHSDAGIVVLLVHPGGPFWRNRDLGAWSIPKGELDDGEDPEAAARREFAEELGMRSRGPAPAAWPGAPASGKIVLAYALEGNLDVAPCAATKSPSNGPREAAGPFMFPKSIARRGSRFPSREKKILAGQQPFLDRLEKL